MPIVGFMTLIVLLHYLMVYRTDTVHYSKLFNPIMLFVPFLLGYWVVVRIGVLPDYFYPTYSLLIYNIGR